MSYAGLTPSGRAGWKSAAKAGEEEDEPEVDAEADVDVDAVARAAGVDDRLRLAVAEAIRSAVLDFIV